MYRAHRAGGTAHPDHLVVHRNTTTTATADTVATTGAMTVAVDTTTGADIAATAADAEHAAGLQYLPVICCVVAVVSAVSYTHLTLPTICSV